MRVAIGVSTELDHIKAATEAVKKAKTGLYPQNPDFALLFTTGELSHPLVLQAIAESLSPIPILGASAKALISTDGPLKYGLILVCFGLSEGIYFNAACVKETAAKTNLAVGSELGEKLLYGCKGVHRNFSIIFADTSASDSEGIITGMQEKLGKSFPLIGASMPPKTDHQKNSLYFNTEILNNACCGVLWGGRLNFSLGIEHGWQPLGKPRYVTKASDDMVYEIDAEPAVNLYREYFAKEIPELRKDLNRLAVFYPLGIAVSEKKEFLLRSVTEIKNDGSLVFQGEVPEKSCVRLMISSKESCLESASGAAHAAAKNIKGKKIKFALVLSSLARYELWGRSANQEIQAVQSVLGMDVPLAGIYTQAEQAPLSSLNYSLGKTYFHNNSIAVLAITD